MTASANTYEQGATLALQGDGRIVVGGVTAPFAGDWDLFLARLDVDGVPDPSFGTGGIVALPMAGSNDWTRSIEIDAQGRIVTVGSILDNGWDILVTRWRADGSLDVDFGSAGVVRTPIGV